MEITEARKNNVQTLIVTVSLKEDMGSEQSAWT